MKTKLLAFIACLNFSYAFANTTLQGSVLINEPLANAPVQIIDSQGNVLSVNTDQSGHYVADISVLQAPLLLSAMNTTPWEGIVSEDCLNNHAPRAQCVASVLIDIKNEQDNIANITPFTDYIVSGMATHLQYPGPQQLIDSKNSAQVNQALVTTELNKFCQAFGNALLDVGLNCDTFNPITSSMNNNDAASILAVIHHNRGYHNDTGQASGIVLSDMRFRPITAKEPLDFKRAQAEKSATLDAPTRILIVSDSTASTYDLERLPRMGWGQLFQQQFKTDSGVVVLNGARAGRSSRDFYNEGWYQQMARFIQPGDYVIIAHGHNDQNCNLEKAVRGPADVKNLCTYPNDEHGQRQYPTDQPELSFQTSLERYIKLAREHGATPIIMTSTTRVRNIDNKIPFENGDMRPVVSRHFTPVKKGYLFSGDYAQTTRKTAQDNQVAFIDLEKMTIDFVNQHPNDWKSYWLAVDQNDDRYPYYKNQNAGTLNKPDTTHLQHRGAQVVAEMVADGIRQEPELAELAEKLK